MPDIPSRWTLSAQLLGVGRPEFAGPSPYRFVRYDNTPLQQHFLDEAQAQRELEIQPDRTGDDRRWKAVVLLTDDRRAHLKPGIPQQLSCRQRDIACTDSLRSSSQEPRIEPDDISTPSNQKIGRRRRSLLTHPPASCQEREVSCRAPGGEDPGPVSTVRGPYRRKCSCVRRRGLNALATAKRLR